MTVFYGSLLFIVLLNLVLRAIIALQDPVYPSPPQERSLLSKRLIALDE